MNQAPPRRGDQEFAGEVNSMFDRISGVYDRMNRVMTAGLDQSWRARAAERARLEPGMKALDLCCGTGDLALMLAERVGPEGEVTGADFSRPMLDIALEKAKSEGLRQARFKWADALDLPFEDESFDALTIAFGARNLADLDRGISEMRRVLVPGGRLVILEITQPKRQPLAGFFALWFDRIVPQLGKLAGDSSAYTYLPESVRSFPDAETLAGKLDAGGLRHVRWTLMAGGIIALHSGVR
ncbi:MAG TPA: bifunctional demethylmenaquinone methyltransferase/2-methoxy-6-polyprenyl-1,4-benzoquinol methylase UbiE [Solirubrobacterales bacterium]|jgi:demethylmenaquinone methyltransferase/2-methoxy-6-polyprenyl-1,4-benzoquinol methylase|nr:bifunctional demethylmenaquinone methyltransferase/2-methoxy-6-polyprenyl-1,4-benzoquinol methylase UbiE [Solirubrobacterales bacterium]HMU28119.1 bifunctional demethylmenaquinone methyltransferase/2-methoxy-6-polyprenyl-1,4-benzoquinol methylase UbiE [Solirubrobacterales bacterium]HMX71192.1 bifunctional demethylmenaquinone methyltransferase/2-methoxy-6-polyprenyl-1,4-benzoquinol methylase UbiE [Solirubrobacterales bacterium]HMY25120.1 bifunctional demethylmenaquinone methyltransferase/2-met